MFIGNALSDCPLKEPGTDPSAAAPSPVHGDHLGHIVKHKLHAVLAHDAFTRIAAFWLGDSGFFGILPP